MSILLFPSVQETVPEVAAGEVGSLLDIFFLPTFGIQDSEQKEALCSNYANQTCMLTTSWGWGSENL